MTEEFYISYGGQIITAIATLGGTAFGLAAQAIARLLGSRRLHKAQQFEAVRKFSTSTQDLVLTASSKLSGMATNEIESLISRLDERGQAVTVEQRVRQEMYRAIRGWATKTDVVSNFFRELILLWHELDLAIEDTEVRNFVSGIKREISKGQSDFEKELLDLNERISLASTLPNSKQSVQIQEWNKALARHQAGEGNGDAASNSWAQRIEFEKFVQELSAPYVEVYARSSNELKRLISVSEVLESIESLQQAARKRLQ